MTRSRSVRKLSGSIVAISLAALVGCGSDSAGYGTPDAGDAGDGTHAYVVSLRVNNADGDRFIYMGAFPDVPTSEPSRDRMVELAGRWQVTGFDGSAFAWEQETAQMTRWTVDADLKLVKGNTMSLANLGLDGWRYHAFVSPTRAYTLGLENGVVAVWNPTTMELVDELSFDPPAAFAGMDAHPLSVIVRGEQVIAPMYGENWDTQEVATRQVVGIIDTSSNAVSFIEDTRCLPSGIGHMNAAGDIYLDPYQSSTYFSHYSQQADLPPPCTLRIKAGEARFDPDYVLDYATALGQHADGVWPINDDLVMALSISADAELPPIEQAQDDYWSLPQVASVINLRTKEAQPYPGLPNDLRMQSALQHVVDGVSYYQNYRYDADGNIEVVEVGALTPSGWENRFEIHGGDLWGVVRIR